MHTQKHIKQIDGLRGGIIITIPGEGTVDRTFHSKGEAIKHLQHKYGNDWKKLRVKFKNT